MTEETREKINRLNMILYSVGDREHLIYNKERLQEEYKDVKPYIESSTDGVHTYKYSIEIKGILSGLKNIEVSRQAAEKCLEESYKNLLEEYDKKIQESEEAEKQLEELFKDMEI